MPGGNSHQRAVERAAQERNKTADSASTGKQQPEPPANRKTVPRKPTANRFEQYAEHLRTIEVVAFVLAIGAILMEHYFWWFVAFMYIGLLIQIVHSVMARAAGNFRYVTAAFFLLVLTLFTLQVVIGTSYFGTTSMWTKGSYTPGTNVHGLLWEDGWSELTFSISNNTNADMKDLDIEFLIDESVVDIKKVDEIPCVIVKSGVHPVDVTVKFSDGRQQLMTPVGYKAPYRLLCDRLPAHTGISLIAALANTDSLERSGGSKQQQGEHGVNDFLGPKRIPRWVKYHASYKVGLRPYSF